MPTPTKPGARPRARTATDAALARSLLKEQAGAVASVADALGAKACAAAFARAVDLLVACTHARGTVLVSGLGKSGLIGAKVSATLASLGVPSHFIHPTEAAHGDLGNFRRADVCIAISYSGETDELVSLASTLRQDGIDVIAICAGRAGASSLERASSVTLAIGDVEDDLSPAPMCSTTATLALGDALALCASRRLGFTSADFNKRHPGGALGGLTRPVTSALRFTVGKNLHPIADDVTVGQALKIADADGRRPGALLLVDKRSGKLTGLVTDGDLRRALLAHKDLLSTPVRAIMTRNPGTLPDRAMIRDAVHAVQRSRRDEIPVVDDAGRPVGLLDVQDLVTMRVVR
jgi:arabinose-5-phosphate isomerase